MVFVEKVGQPIASETTAWLYGEENDLQRLEADLKNVLHLPTKQVESVMSQLRRQVEITIANEVADDSSVLDRFPPVAEKNFRLAIVSQAEDLSENASRPLTELTPEDRPGGPPPLSYFNHPVQWLRHFTSVELARFGMTAGATFSLSGPSRFKF